MNEGSLKDRSSPLEGALRRALAELVPEAELCWQPIQGTGLHGFLVEGRKASSPLSAASVERVMENPPFWSLLWPSGHLLCRLLDHHPELVELMSCVDLGCGCGLVSVALARAGAMVTAVDLDPLSLQLTSLHRARAGVSLEVASSWSEDPTGLLVLADFLYDDQNFDALARLAGEAEEVLVADSRLRALESEGFVELGAFEEVAVPDLDPHREFGTVRVWYRGGRSERWSRSLKELQNRR